MAGGSRPILHVPVDDAAFQRLFDRMGEYQEMLEGLGDKWKQQDESVGSLAATMLMVTAALETQRELLAEQAANTKALEDAEKEKARELTKQEKAERDAEKRRHQAVEDTKKIARNIRDATLDLAKWTFMGGAAGVIGGAASLWGLDKVANWAGDQRRAAMGERVSIPERQALQARFGRFFDADTVLGNVAAAQTNPYQAQIFAALGINPNGKDPAELAIEMAIATRQRLQNIPLQSRAAYTNAIGIDQIFSPAALNTIMGERAGGLERQRGLYQGDINSKDMKDFTDAAEKWQDLTAELQIRIFSALDPLISDLASPEIQNALQTIMRQFGALADEVLERIDWNVLGTGLQHFSDMIADGKFQAGFKEFIDDVVAISQHLTALLKFIGWIPDADPNHVAATAAGKAAAGTGIGNPWLTGAMAHLATQFALGGELGKAGDPCSPSDAPHA